MIQAGWPEAGEEEAEAVARLRELPLGIGPVVPRNEVGQQGLVGFFFKDRKLITSDECLSCTGRFGCFGTQTWGTLSSDPL